MYDIKQIHAWSMESVGFCRLESILGDEIAMYGGNAMSSSGEREHTANKKKSYNNWSQMNNNA